MDAPADVTAVPVIYKILGMSNDDQLAPLVDTLTQTPLSILKICRAYERHAPNHSRYTDQIGDEIYRLGQKALNITDGSRPSYQRMIDVMQTAGVACPGGRAGRRRDSSTQCLYVATSLVDPDRQAASSRERGFCGCRP